MPDLVAVIPLRGVESRFLNDLNQPENISSILLDDSLRVLSAEDRSMVGKALTEISDAIKGGMTIIPVARLDDVVSKALVRPPVPIVWEEDTAKVPVKTTDGGDEAAGGLTAH